MEFKVECHECYTEFNILITDGDELEEIVCCPFCGNTDPKFEIIEEE